MFDDLRGFLKIAEELGEVQHIDGADSENEIGVLTELVGTRGPALLFDNIKGYKKGFRVVSNSFASYKRTALAANLPLDLPPLELLKAWRKRLKSFTPVLPREVSDGPILENVDVKDQIDITKFPAPLWHKGDGGRYIGTGCSVITKDPDDQSINVGVYRSMVIDKGSVTVLPQPGKHGYLAMDKYHQRGEPAPIVITFGQDPTFWFASAFPSPYGVNEFDFAGFMKGAPIDTIRGKITDLPIPATAEIAIEGEVPPPSVESSSEGPFGEWFGYYVGGFKAGAHKVRIKSTYYRNDPIILGNPPLKPPTPMHWAVPFEAAEIWEEIIAAGIQDVTGVWQALGFWGPAILILSIKYRYLGQAKQAALAAASCRKGAWGGRVIIVVNDDIDITSIEDVLWALVTRCDPKEDVTILTNIRTSYLDPLTTHIPEEQKRVLGAASNRILFDACKDLSRFPKVNESDPKTRKEIVGKWKDKLPFLATK